MRIQPATRAMLQKQLIKQNTKLLLKMTVSNLKKTCTNTALFEFSLAKSDIRQFPNYFWFHPPILQGPFTRWITNKLKIICESSLLHTFYNIQKYSTIPSFTKGFEIMAEAALGKNLEPPMLKWNNDSYLQENQEL